MKPEINITNIQAGSKMLPEDSLQRVIEEEKNAEIHS